MASGRTLNIDKLLQKRGLVLRLVDCPKAKPERVGAL